MTTSGTAQEDAINAGIARILSRERNWKAREERTGRIVGKSGKKPDIIVEISGNAVVVETEFHPAPTLDGDVQKVLNYHIKSMGPPAVIIGVVLPPELKYNDDDLPDDMIATHTDFRYYIQWMDGSKFPENGYLKGSITDIKTALRLVSIPQEKIKQCIELMRESIDEISYGIKRTKQSVQNDICKHIKQNPSDQTWGMAGLILLNAGIFYEELASHREGIKPTESLKVLGVLPQESVIKEWEAVLKIDYETIFQDAVKILQSLPADIAAKILDTIASAVSKIMGLGVSKSGDVYGSLYQGMLGDRKKIAAFYTRPQAATLLAGLVMPPVSDDIWKDSERIKGLRIADFACGTGMLLTAAYRHIIHNATFDVGSIHSHIMENCLYGYDIMPTATHLTVSNLAELFPEEVFDKTHVYTMPIGKINDSDGYHLGSLDIIKDTEKFIKAGEQHGGHGSQDTKIATVLNFSCDYVIMNPPYVRATNHGVNITDPVPPFAVFGIPPEDQILMSQYFKQLYQGTCSHGNAGLASTFIAISHQKLKPGGIMGLILPETIVSGASWEPVRKTLHEWYDDFILVFVGSGDGTYSSDTGMNETMLIARKREQKRTNENAPPRIKLALLDKMPGSLLESLETAKCIKTITPVRLEDNAGHTSIQIGKNVVGRMADCPTDVEKWWAGHVTDFGIYQLAYSMANNLPYKLVYDGETFRMVVLKDIGDIGPLSRDITENGKSATPRGPFNKVSIVGKPTYPCLWGNDSKIQTTMKVEPDWSLEKKHNATMQHVNNIWGKATHAHVNCQARYTSQKLIAAYTNEKSLGGRGWLNVLLDKAHEKAFTVWCNSVFGIMMYWVTAGSQQGGRGMMSPTVFRTRFPIPDFGELSKKQLSLFNRIFDENSEREMLPINRLDNDPVRQTLDRGILDIFDIDMELTTRYKQLCNEQQFCRNA